MYPIHIAAQGLSRLYRIGVEFAPREKLGVHLRFELFSGEHKVQLTERITLSLRRERRRLQVVGIDIGIEFESRSSPTAALPLAFDRVQLD